MPTIPRNNGGYCNCSLLTSLAVDRMTGKRLQLLDVILDIVLDDLLNVIPDIVVDVNLNMVLDGSS